MIKHIEREIYEVTAKVVDASGGYNNLSGKIGNKEFTFPMQFDSHQNDDDLEKTFSKAKEAYSAGCSLGYGARATGRPLTIVSLLRVSDGRQIDKEQIGSMPTIDVEIPDPEPEDEEEEPEVNPEEPEQNGGE